MKKISFGSFPMINLDKESRTCLDKYLIKTFAEQMVVTDIFNNLQTAKDYFYLTPETIIDKLSNNAEIAKIFGSQRNSGGGSYNSSNDSNDSNDSDYSAPRNPELDQYTQEDKILHENSEIIRNRTKTVLSKIIFLEENGKTQEAYEYYTNEIKNVLLEEAIDHRAQNVYLGIIKRAFYIIRHFYQKISKDSFYKDIVVLPVYSEKLSNLRLAGETSNNAIHTDYNYSFFLLTNDLMRSLKLDEISYNDSMTVNALYIFSQLFPHKALTDFDKDDLEYIIKMYKLFETNKINPVDFFVILYYFLYIFGVSSSVNSIKDLDQKIKAIESNPQLKDVFEPGILYQLKKYFDNLKPQEKLQFFSKTNKELRNAVKMGSKNKKTGVILSVIDHIMKNKDLYNVIVDVSSETTLIDRQIALRERVRYKDIITLFTELAAFNEKKFDDIVKDSNLDLNFKVELNGSRFVFNSQLVKDKLEKGYGNVIVDFNKYLINISEKEKNSLENDNNHKKNSAFEQVGQDIDKRIKLLEAKKKELQEEMHKLRFNPNNLDENYLRTAMNNLSNELLQIDNELAGLVTERNTSSIYSTLLNDNMVSKKMNDEINKILNEIKAIDNQLKLYQNNQSFDDSLRNGLLQRREELSQKYQNYVGVDSLSNSEKNDIYSINSFKKFKGFTLNLKDAKEEMVGLYESLARLFLNEEGLEAFIQEGVTTTEDFYRILQMRTHSTESTDILQRAFIDIHESIDDVIDAMIEQLKMNLEAAYINQREKNSIISALDKVVEKMSQHYEKLRKEMIQRMIKIIALRIFKPFNHSFKKMIQNDEMKFKEVSSGIHPLIAKLLKDPNHFKSFIFGFDMLDDLYKLIYLTDTKRYIIGASSGGNHGIDYIQRMPVKLNNIKNRIDYVITNVLKIDKNPLWIVSRQKFFLSLPEYLSLVKERIFSSIDKANIKDYCKIDYQKIWSEGDFGKVLSMENAQKIVNELTKKYKELEDKKKDRDKCYDSAKNDKKKNKKNCSKLANEVKKIEAEIKNKKAAIAAIGLNEEKYRYIGPKSMEHMVDDRYYNGKKDSNGEKYNGHSDKHKNSYNNKYNSHNTYNKK